MIKMTLITQNELRRINREIERQAMKTKKQNREKGVSK